MNKYSFLILFIPCIINQNILSQNKKTDTHMKTLTVTSENFKSGSPIPPKYSGEFRDISPQLSWSGAPEGTQSYVIIVDDPDAPGGTWVHWVVFNLPANVTELPESANIQQLGGIVGKNSFSGKKQNKYGGPKPPVGHGVHRYFFKVYALNKKLDLDNTVTKDDVEKAMQKHIIAKQENFLGTYERKK